jgi:hypothetical protein
VSDELRVEVSYHPDMLGCVSNSEVELLASIYPELVLLVQQLDDSESD